MTALEEIKKALEKVYIGEWYVSGVKTNGLSVVYNAADISMFGITADTFEAEYIVAVNPSVISELLSTFETYRIALKSIAANTCCDKCREAALVARTALDSTGGEDHAE